MQLDAIALAAEKEVNALEEKKKNSEKDIALETEVDVLESVDMEDIFKAIHFNCEEATTAEKMEAKLFSDVSKMELVRRSLISPQFNRLWMLLLW